MYVLDMYPSLPAPLWKVGVPLKLMEGTMLIYYNDLRKSTSCTTSTTTSTVRG